MMGKGRQKAWDFGLRARIAKRRVTTRAAANFIRRIIRTRARLGAIISHTNLTRVGGAFTFRCKATVVAPARTICHTKNNNCRKE